MEFIGNDNAKLKLGNWLNEFYHKKVVTTCPNCSFPIISELKDFLTCPKCQKDFEYETKRYAIIYGLSGNGKTEICKFLADKLGIELFRITPIDIECEKDCYNVIKSVNTQTLDCKRNKLVLIDDLDDYHKNYAKKLKQIPEISDNPVIYTMSSRPFFKDDFTKYAVVVEVKKPLSTTLFKYLRNLSKLSDKQLKEIAEKSPSFRSAVLSSKSANINDLIEPYKDRYRILKDINKRKLVNLLTKEDLFWFFNSIRGYDVNTLSVMKKISEFDYIAWTRFTDIDPFFINVMEEPIEKVNLKLKTKENPIAKDRQETKKKEKKDKKEDKNNKETKPFVTLDGWI